MRAMVRAGAILVIFVLPAAGCATRPAMTGRAGLADQPGPSLVPHGSRAQAAALGRRMLASLVLPPGARPLRARPLPRGLRQPGELMGYGRYSVDLREVRALSQPMADAQSFLANHVPAGMVLAGTGNAGGPSGPTADFASFSWRTLPGGIYLASLVVEIVPAARGDGSVIRADAQVMWYPRRSAAEYVAPGRFRAVTVLVTDFRSRARRRTFTAQAVIDKLARLFNDMPAEPSVTFHCPPITAGYQVTFEPASSGQPPVVMSPTGCSTVAVHVRGRAQPTLFGGPAVISLIIRLLR